MSKVDCEVEYTTDINDDNREVDCVVVTCSACGHETQSWGHGVSSAKESFLRDIARLRGGDNDFVVAATLDIAALRAFQSRAKRWPEEGDKFKPVPEGFILQGDRRKLPPK